MPAEYDDPWHSDFDPDDDAEEAEPVDLDSATMVDLFGGVVEMFPLVVGSASLRLAPSPHDIGRYLESVEAGFSQVFSEMFLFPAPEEAPEGVAFRTLASLELASPGSGRTWLAEISVLSFAYQLRVYFVNGGGGYNLIGGGVPLECETATDLDSSLLKAVFDSNGERIGFPLSDTVPHQVSLDDRFAMDFWIDRFLRCFDVAREGRGFEWERLREQAMARFEEQVSCRCFEHEGEDLPPSKWFDSLITRAQIGLWLEGVRKTEEEV